MYCQGDLWYCCPVCDLEYLWEYVDRYVSHFLDARFFRFRSSSGHHVLVYLGGKNHDYWLYFKRQYPIC